MATLLGARRSAGLTAGLELVVGSLKALLREFLFSMSSRHAHVSRSVVLRLRKARLYLQTAPASPAHWSACSFPSTPLWEGAHRMEMVLPWVSSCRANLRISTATSCPGPGAESRAKHIPIDSQFIRHFSSLALRLGRFTRVCVCVILYFYPATCGPKGHGSGGSCFYIPLSLAPGPA